MIIFMERNTCHNINKPQTIQRYLMSYMLNVFPNFTKNDKSIVSYKYLGFDIKDLFIMSNVSGLYLFDIHC